MLSKYKKQLASKNELYLRIKVSPGSPKTLIKTVLDDGTIKIDVAAMPVKGEANRELIKFLARELDVAKNNIAIISGAKNRIKLIKIINSPCVNTTEPSISIAQG